MVEKKRNKNIALGINANVVTINAVRKEITTNIWPPINIK